MVGTNTEIETYNYSAFGFSEPFSEWRNVLPCGSQAPDVSLVELDSGKTVQLSSFWQQRDVVLEFGSLT